MLDAARDDAELARGHLELAVAQAHADRALHDEKHLVLVLVEVPRERPEELRDLHVLPVELADDLRHVSLVEPRELLGKADLIHHPATVSPNVVRHTFVATLGPGGACGGRLRHACRIRE